MPKYKIRKRARKNPTSVTVSSGGGESSSIWMQGGAGVGTYVGARVVGNIAGNVGAKRNWRRGAKILTAAAALAAAWYLPQRSSKLRKYRMAIIMGAAIALVQSLVEEFAPKLAELIGLTPGMLQGPSPAQLQAVKQQQQRIAARRTVVPHADDAQYDAMEASYYERNAYASTPGGPGQPGYNPTATGGYGPPPATTSPYPPGAEPGGEDFEDAEDYGASGIFID